MQEMNFQLLEMDVKDSESANKRSNDNGSISALCFWFWANWKDLRVISKGVFLNFEFWPNLSEK